MRRRDFITLLGGSAAAWPLAARAQQGDRLPRIGVLMPFDENDPAGKRNDRRRRVCQDDVGLQADQLLRERSYPIGVTAAPTKVHPHVAAVQRETRTIPIVFANVADPVAISIVARLDRPNGNVTGFASFEATLGGKWLELLSEVASGLKRVAIMFNPDTAPASAYMPSLETAARSLNVVPIITPVHSDVEIETAIIALGREPGSGLIVMLDIFTTVHRAPIISAVARNNVPAVYPLSEFARDGGLLGYGTDQLDTWRRAATYVDRILRGDKPSDLPVEFPTKFEMAVNLRTAKALGLAVPPSILLRADEVIE